MYEREVCVEAAHPSEGRLQAVEATLLYFRENLGAEAARDGGLMGDDHPAGLIHRPRNGVDVPWDNRLQVDHLA
eukprot:CAMPEP_0119495092 /NCGR_PEP_ID=MMETSP1344-20130328/18842_1 /TAXON_ID=236787 /ORGANISM="Florenciella parvula, Strain CCMP2471" /LENGTH=73 /DNA_ID=CAMNT_0007530653 /DNA_START=272 /DNA_END=489 /DNA_ORIENTATION=+